MGPVHRFQQGIGTRQIDDKVLEIEPGVLDLAENIVQRLPFHVVTLHGWFGVGFGGTLRVPVSFHSTFLGVPHQGRANSLGIIYSVLAREGRNAGFHVRVFAILTEGHNASTK